MSGLLLGVAEDFAIGQRLLKLVDFGPGEVGIVANDQGGPRDVLGARGGEVLEPREVGERGVFNDQAAFRLRLPLAFSRPSAEMQSTTRWQSLSISFR